MRLLICLLACTWALAQDLPPTTPSIAEELVVSGQFRPVSPMASVIPVQIFSRAQIDARGAANLRELLAPELQIDLNHHSVFGTSLQIGGLSGENLKILVDGAPVIGRLDGIIDLEQIPLAQVERVELIQGPMSVYYGTDAFAGVVNLITPRTSEGRKMAEATLDLRDNGDRRLALLAELDWGREGLLLTAEGREFAGYDENPADRSQSWPERDQQSYGLTYEHRFDGLIGRYRAAFADESLYEPAAAAAGIIWDHDYATRRMDQQLSLTGSLGKTLWLDAQMGLLSYDRTRDDIALSAGEPTGTITRDPQFDTSFDTRFAKALLSWQSSAQFEWQTGLQWNDDRGDGGRLSTDRGALTEQALILGCKWSAPYGIDVQPSLRLTDHNRYDMPALPALAIHQHRAGFDWRASYAKGFRGPSLKQLYLEFAMAAGPSFYRILGNESLNPEQGEAYQAQLELPWRIGNQQFRAVVEGFLNRTHDLIQLSAAQPDGPLPNHFLRTYINISDQESKGAVARLNWQGRYLDTRLALARNIYQNTLEASQPLPRFNRSWDGQLGLDARFAPRFSAHLDYAYNGQRPGYVAIGRPTRIEAVELEAWHGLDLALRWHAPMGPLNIQIAVRNLFDVTAQNAVYSASGTAHSSSQIDWGRTYQLVLGYRAQTR